MRYPAILVLFFILSLSRGLSQGNFRVMFYNAENLFDTIDNPRKMDDDFLPDGFMRWSSWKYWEKLRNITRVITAVGEMESPALVGLCEVENDSVLVDLTRKSPLRVQDYQYVMSNSPDERGINVALLFQRHQFKLLEKAEYEIRFVDPDRRPTRNILHATGVLISGDTLDVFVAHFPSRSGGARASLPARQRAAEVLRIKTDSIMGIRSEPRCLIMGDFNDPPDSDCLRDGLQTLEPTPPYDDLSRYNLCYDLMPSRELGTYKYQGRWEVIDQFIVNGKLLDKDEGVHVLGGAKIYAADFLLKEDIGYYGKKPRRTSAGPRYGGGCSDHLPIYLDLMVYE